MPYTRTNTLFSERGEYWERRSKKMNIQRLNSGLFTLFSRATMKSIHICGMLPIATLTYTQAHTCISNMIDVDYLSNAKNVYCIYIHIWNTCSCDGLCVAMDSQHNIMIDRRLRLLLWWFLFFMHIWKARILYRYLLFVAEQTYTYTYIYTFIQHYYLILVFSISFCYFEVASERQSNIMHWMIYMLICMILIFEIYYSHGFYFTRNSCFNVPFLDIQRNK